MTWTTAIILLGMLAYAVIHSLLAGQSAKQYFRNRFGDRAYHGLYCTVYNIVAVLTIAPILGLIVLQPGVIGDVLSLLQADLGQFSGIRQLQAYLIEEPLPLPPTPLRTDGVYRFVRHPLYFFPLLVLWASPAMTSSLLAFTVGMTLYFVIGSRLEEKRLVKSYGAEFADYRQRTPGLSRILIPAASWELRTEHECAKTISMRFSSLH